MKPSHHPFTVNISVEKWHDIVDRLEGRAGEPSPYFLKSLYAFKHCPIQIVTKIPPLVKNMLKLGIFDYLKFDSFLNWEKIKVTFYKGKIIGLSFTHNDKFPMAANTFAIEKFPDITRLDYSQQKIGLDEAKALYALLENKPKLRELILDKSSIGDEDAKVLAGLMKNNKKLEVSMKECRCSQKAQQHLKKLYQKRISFS